MNDIDIKSLLRQNEGETLEFKRFEKLENMNDKKKKDLVKLFVALANNKGGKILFGVTDDRKFDDYNLTENKYKLFSQKLIQIADSNCNPPIYLNNIQQIKINDHIILLVDVPSGNDIPHAFEGKFYKRIHDQNIIIEDPIKIKELIEQKKEKYQETVIEKEEEQSEDTFHATVEKYLDSIANDDDELGISKVYEELSAKISLKKRFPITLKVSEQENSREEEFKILDLVKKEKNLIISGGSGSGKTITLKWLNIIFAKKYLEESNCSIPLYIELNTYNEDHFYKYIKDIAKEKGLSESILNQLLNGKLIFLIDGLDLLSPTKDFKPHEDITNFISKYSNCKYVISSRPVFLEGIRNEFKISELKELDETNIKSFVSNYIIDEELANNIMEQILNNDKLISLFRNPMMLYLAITFLSKGPKDELKFNKVIPSKRSNLYKNFIYKLFKCYKNKSKSLNTDKTRISNTLINLSFKLQCQNNIDCTCDYATGIASKYSYDDKPESANDILRDILNIGILLKDKSRNGIEDYVKYEFHQSFLEYFAALKLKDCFESGYDLSPVFKHPKWGEVVIFAAEMVNFPDDFIDKMIDSHEFDLASKCAQNASEDMKEKLCKCLAEKIDVKYTSDRTDAIESLSRLGDIGIDLISEVADDEDDNINWYADYVRRKINSGETVKSFMEALNDKSELAQLNAITTSGNIKSDENVKLLIEVLANKSDDVDVRRSTANVLGEIKSNDAVKPLTEVLANKSDDVDVRRSAADALGKIKSNETVEHLIKVLENESDDVDVRRNAANALGKIKSHEAVKPLIKALNDKNDNVRGSAADALGEINSDKAIRPLIRTLNDEKDAMRRNVADVLQQLLEHDLGKRHENHSIQVDIADTSIKNKSVETVKLFIEALNNGMQRSVADSLHNLLENNPLKKYENYSVRIGTADTSVKNKLYEAIKLFIEALNDENDSTRKSAVNALKKIESEKAVKLFIKVLDDKNDMRISAIGALGKIKSDKAIQPLIKVLNDENDDMRRSLFDALQQLVDDPEIKEENVDMQISAAFALGEIQSDKAIQSLIGVLNNKSDFLRRSAVDALGKIGSDEAVITLIKLLDDETEDVQISVIDALGKIKSEEAVKPLIEVLKYENEDINVQRSVVYALGKIESDRAVELFIEMLEHDNNDVRKNAVEILSEIKSKEAVPSLIAVLIDVSDDVDVRRSVVYALGEIKSKEAVPSLIAVLIDVSDDIDVRRSVVYALGEIKSKEAVEHLIEVLTDENDDVDVRRSVVYALGEIKSKEAVEHLIEVLTNEVYDVRSVVNALGKIKSKEAVLPLIKVLEYEYEYIDFKVQVQRSVVYALGEIKSKEAGTPLITMMNDERDDDVRMDVADAFGKIRSNEAVEPLINVLNTKNEFLRIRVVNALNNVITTENENLLRSLLKSENENVYNTSCDLLKKIGEIKRSEEIIKLNKTQNSENEDSNNLDNLELPCGKPAKEGSNDPYINTFMSRLRHIKEPTSIVDYGCGQGKLLCALKILPDVVVKNISYFGVDEKTLCRYISRLTCKKYKLDELFRNNPEFLKPKKFYSKDIKLDYAFLMHALHEIKLIDLIEIVYSISTKLKLNGMIFILDQRKLVEEERNYVLWDENDFETLFSNSGFEVYQSFPETKSGNKLSLIEAIKIQENCFPKETVKENCLKVYESKKVIVSNMRNEAIDTEEHKNLSGRYADISVQIDDLKCKHHDEMLK